MDRFTAWLSRYDWGAFIGTALVFVFVTFVVLPAYTGIVDYEHARHQAAQSAPPISSADAAAWAVANYTKALAWFTAVLAIVSAFQLWFLRRSDETARISADAALANAKTAERQVESVVSAERPYVFVEVLESGVEVSENGAMRFATKKMKFQFANYGRTPALFHELVELYPVIEGIQDGPPILNPDSDLDRGRLLPDGTISSPLKPYVLETNLMNHTNVTRLYQDNAWKTCRLWFHGYVRYSDTFGNHYIKGFALVFRPTQNVWMLRGGEKWNFTRTEDVAKIPPHPRPA